MSLFSIITVCFNSENTIERTIKSIFQQQFSNYEYIIVDGGSKDCTLEIIKRYEPLFEGRMKWISEPDNGIYDAMNKGILKATGKYVWIVNSDDYIEPDALEYLSDHMSKEQDGIVYCGSLRYFDEETGNTLFTESMNERTCKRAFKLDQTNVVHPATIVGKTIYEKYGYYDEHYRILADCEWAHRVYKENVPFVFFDKILTNMSNGGVSGSQSWSRFAKSHSDRKMYFKKFYSNFIERNLRFLFWDIRFLYWVIKRSSL